MKKRIALILAALLALGMLGGCKSTEPAVTTAPEATAPSDTEPVGKGFGSALGMTACGITAAACAAVALKKRKED